MSNLLVIILDAAPENADQGGAVDHAIAVLRGGVPGVEVQVVGDIDELRSLAEARNDLVAVHDPVVELDVEVLGRLLQLWEDDGECVAAAVCGEMTETLKQVDREGDISATLDRDAYVSVIGPLVVTGAALSAALAVQRATSDILGDLTATLDRTVGVRRVMFDSISLP